MAIGAAAKCGSTSLRKAIQGDDHLGCALDNNRRLLNEVPDVYWAVGIVRHPVARFYSLYRNIQERHRSRNNYYAQFEGLSPEDCLRAMIDREGLDYELHTHPQTSIGIQLADEIIRLEDMGDWWKRTFDVEFPHKNSSDTLIDYQNDNHVATLIRGVYADDLKLWESADGQNRVS